MPGNGIEGRVDLAGCVGSCSSLLAILDLRRSTRLGCSCSRRCLPISTLYRLCRVRPSRPGPGRARPRSRSDVGRIRSKNTESTLWSPEDPLKIQKLPSMVRASWRAGTGTGMARRRRGRRCLEPAWHPDSRLSAQGLGLKSLGFAERAAGGSPARRRGTARQHEDRRGVGTGRGELDADAR